MHRCTLESRVKHEEREKKKKKKNSEKKDRDIYIYLSIYNRYVSMHYTLHFRPGLFIYRFLKRGPESWQAFGQSLDLDGVEHLYR
jgi:hypothetical protein